MSQPSPPKQAVPADGAELTGDAEALQEQLRNVYWIGGGSGAGKSTIARRIAAEHGLQPYATDDVMADHAKRSTPEDCPLLNEFMAVDMDERWVNRSPREMLETFHWFRGEGFSMIIEDILRLPRESGVIVDGFRLLPHLVKPLSPCLVVLSGSSQLPSSVRPRSIVGFRNGGLSRKQAILNGPSAICLSATPCSPSVSTRKRSV
jgi:hypothetical protein